MARIPKFKTEDEERDYWDQHSPLEHLDELTESDTIQVKERRPRSAGPPQGGEGQARVVAYRPETDLTAEERRQLPRAVVKRPSGKGRRPPAR